MRPGSVLITTSVEHCTPAENGKWNRFRFQAPKGKQFALMFLGEAKGGEFTVEQIRSALAELGFLAVEYEL